MQRHGGDPYGGATAAVARILLSPIHARLHPTNGLLFSLPRLAAAEPHVSCAQLGYANAEWSRSGGNHISILKVALVPTFTVGATRLFATLGYYRANIDANLALPDTESTDSGAVVGVGARWYFSDPWSVSVQAMRFDDNLQQLMFGVGWGLRRERDESESN